MTVTRLWEEGGSQLQYNVESSGSVENITNADDAGVTKVFQNLHFIHGSSTKDGLEGERRQSAMLFLWPMAAIYCMERYELLREVKPLCSFSNSPFALACLSPRVYHSNRYHLV